MEHYDPFAAGALFNRREKAPATRPEPFGGQQIRAVADTVFKIPIKGDAKNSLQDYAAAAPAD